MKRGIALLLVIAMCACLFACGKAENPAGTPSMQNNGTGTPSGNENGSGETTTPAAESTPATTAPIAPGLEMSDDLADFTISIDGVVYQFPCSPMVFFDNGWLPKMDWILEEDYLYPGDAKGFIDLYKEGENKEITLHSCNLSKNDAPLSECIIYGVYNEIDTDVEFTLSGNLTLTDAVTEQTIVSVMESSSDSQNKVEYDWYQLNFPGRGEYTFVIEDGFLSYFDLTLASALYEN